MYKTEKELVVEITKFLENPSFAKILFDKKGKSKVFEELNLGYGIPDVVIVQYNNSYQFNTRKSFLKYFDISILDLIERKEFISFEDIVYLTRSPKNKINTALSLLQGENLITFREGKYFSHIKYSEALEGSIAIEAKLKNWKRALQQAYRYKWFSKKSFVILPINNIKAALNNLDLFRKYEVGLAGIDAENGLNVFYNPAENIPYSETMSKLLNEYLLSDLSSV